MFERAQSKKSRDGLLKKVEKYIASYSSHRYGGTKVGDVLDHVTDTRGKMLRPKLLLLAGEFGPDYAAKQDKLCKLAAMVEMTHMASLIHDDIIDDAPLRRGKLSLQKRFGKDAAVYAGDFLMCSVSLHVIKEKLTDSGVHISETVEKMCAGEIGQSACRFSENVTVSEYLKNIHGKTAALFMVACRIGAQESGCDEETTAKLEKLGEHLGIMFQLRDDLLDFTSDAESIGKDAHKDFLDGIYTMPVLCALEAPGGREKLLPILRENKENGLSADELSQMEKTVVELGGVEATRREILARSEMAKEILRTSLPQNDASVTICEMIDRLCEAN